MVGRKENRSNSMIRCLRCHRPLKNPPAGGNYGPVCAKTARPTPEVTRDLFGYDLNAAALAAQARLAEFVDLRAWQARSAISIAFKEARKQLVWGRP